MPKKSTKLSELLLDIDKDQICDILLNLAESSPEADNRIRTLIAPKSQLNNPVSYYKKLLKKLPSRIKNASDRKLLLEGLNPLLTQIKDLQNTKNYLEANKPLFVILEIILLKLAKSELKSMLGEMQKSAIAWCENLDKINNSELQFNALQEVLELENTKELKLEPRVLGYGFEVDGMVPTYSNGLHTDFYQLLLQLPKSINPVSVLEDLRGFLTKHKRSKAFSLQLLNISQKLDSEDDFIKKVCSNLQTRESALLLKDFYWNKGEFVKAVKALYQHILFNQKYFQYKSSDEYTSAKEYVEIYDKNPEYCKAEDYCEILTCLITTGEYNTAQDVTYGAKWRDYMFKLITATGKDFGQHYQNIVRTLIDRRLDKMVAHFALAFKDQKLLSKYLSSIDTWLDMVQSCEIIATDYPEIALHKISNISRSFLFDSSRSYYYEDDFRDIISRETLLGILENIKANIGEESYKKIED
jgi:tetratricopeptide (TPR) repeat protein